MSAFADPKRVEELCVQVFGVPTRLEILLALAASKKRRDDRCLRLSQLAELMMMSPERLQERHMNVLLRLDLVKIVEPGRNPLYDITDDGLRVVEVVYKLANSKKRGHPVII